MPTVGNSKYYIIAAFSWFCFNSNILAQDTLGGSTTGLEELLNTKVVSPTRNTKTISQAPANVVVITQEQIDARGYLSLEDVLKDIAGFDFSTGQPSGEYPTHFLQRGIGSVGQTKVALLVDGVSQNDVSNGWIRHIGYNFTLTDIDRIEIVSGPGSSLYGGNAYAGYINIVTKSPLKNEKEKLYLKTKTIYGSDNTVSPELLASYNFNNGLAIQFSGRYFYSNGDQGIGRNDPGNYFQNNYEPDSVLTFDQGIIANELQPDGTSKPLNDGYKNNINNYYIRGKIMNDEMSISFSSWDKKEGLSSEVPGYEYFANSDVLDYQIHHSGKSFNLAYNVDLNQKVTSKSRMYFLSNSIKPETGFTYTWGYQSVNNGIDSIETDKKKQYTSDGFAIGVDQQINAELSKSNNLLIGFQVEQKIREYFYIRFIEGVPIPEYEIDTLQSSLRPHSEYVSKNGAVFINDEQMLFKNTSLTMGVRFDFDEFYGNIFSPRLALVRSVKNGFNYKVLLGQGYRPPSIFELYDEWRGNKKLQAEIIKTGEVELGFKQKFFSITSNLFYSQLNDIIEIGVNPDTMTIPIGIAGQHIDYYQNLGNKSILGISLSGNFILDKRVFLYGNYQFLTNPESSEALDNVAAHKINVGLNILALKKINFNIRGNWIGKIKAPTSNKYFYAKTDETIAEVGYDYVTEDNPDGYLDGSMVLNLTVTGKNLMKNKKIQIEPYFIIRNLLNQQYAYMGRQSGNGTRPVDNIQSSIRNPNGFIPAYHPQPGIQIFGGLKVSFN